MALSMICPPCANGDCEKHIPHSGAEGLIGGVSCPCRHTEAEKQERREAWEKFIAEKFGAALKDNHDMGS